MSRHCSRLLLQHQKTIEGIYTTSNFYNFIFQYNSMKNESRISNKRITDTGFQQAVIQKSGALKGTETLSFNFLLVLLFFVEHSCPCFGSKP